MSTQTITLTPPIDGVQYGISSEMLPSGYMGAYAITWASGKAELFCSNNRMADSRKLIAKKVLFCTNPKDTRFPYLVLPSKEQEYIKKLAQKVFDEHKGPASENEANYLNGRYNGIIEGFNANPAKYTQEQMEKAYNHAMWACGDTGHGQSFNEYIQSLQPTAKAVRVEMEVDLHSLKSSITSKSTISISAFSNIKVETSSEHSQGIVRAIEVIN